MNVFVTQDRIQLVAVRVKRPQVDDRDNAELLEIAQAFVGRLRAPIQVLLTLKDLECPLHDWLRLRAAAHPSTFGSESAIASKRR